MSYPGMNGPWGMPPPNWYFPSQQPSDITFEQKLRIFEDVDAYRTRLKNELKAEKPKEDVKKDEKPKKWFNSPITVGLLMILTFPFWAVALLNAYDVAFKQLAISLKHLSGT